MKRFIPEKLHKYFTSTKPPVTTQSALPSSQPLRPLYFGQGIEIDLHAQQIVTQSCIQQSIAHTIHV